MNRLAALLLMAAVALTGNCSLLDVGRTGEDAILPGYARNEVEERLSMLDLHRIEGLWEMTGGGALLAIERDNDAGDGSYRIVVVEAADRRLLSGTAVGRIERAGKAGMYIGKMFTQLKGDKLLLPKTFSMKFDEDTGLMECMRNRSTIRINLWHFVPFLYRNSVRTVHDSNAAHHGLKRIYPQPSIPLDPIYL